MPHETADWGLPVPDDSDPLADVYDFMRQLAQGVELAVNGLTPSIADIWDSVEAPQWDCTSHACIRTPVGFLWVDLSITNNTGSAVTFPSDGNLSPDITIGAFRVPYRPTRAQFLQTYRTGVGTMTTRFNSNGTLQLTDGRPGLTIPDGGAIRVCDWAYYL